MGGTSRVTVSHLLFAIILILGASLRLNGLGAAPLSEAESRVALQALGMADGREMEELGTHAGYAALTGLLFFLFGDTNFIARVLPALAGVLLVVVPWVLRGRLGMPVALVMSAGLALDPLLVGVSRLADGPMLAAGLFGLAAALRIDNGAAGSDFSRRIAAGALFGLAVLSGPGIWIGLLILPFAWGTARLAGLHSEDERGQAFPAAETAAFILTMVLAGTLFLRAPQGLNALAGSLIEFLRGWTMVSNVPALRLLIALAGYQGFVIVFAAVGAWSGQVAGTAAQRGFLIFAMVALSVLLIYPGRQVADLVWVVGPLWGPAAAAIAAALRPGQRPAQRPALLAIVLVVLSVSFWVNLAGLSGANPQDPNYNLRLMVLGGTLVLAGLSILLTALGWETRSAGIGTLWSLAILLVFGLISGVLGSSHLAGPERRDLWVSSPVAGEGDLLAGTLNELGAWSNGSPASLDVTIGFESASVEWVLRHFPNISHGMVFAPGELPSAIVTDTVNQNFQIASAYRGQGLTWGVNVEWDHMTGSDWLRWLLFREAPSTNEQIVIWARADLFLAGGEVAIDDLTGEGVPETPPEEIIPLEDVEDVLPDG